MLIRMQAIGPDARDGRCRYHALENLGYKKRKVK